MGLRNAEADGLIERLTTMRRPDADPVDPSLPWRRAAAITSVFGYGLVMGLMNADLPELVGAGGTLVVLLAWLVALWVVLQFRRRLANAPDAALDEREIRVRDRAFLNAHRLLTAALFVAGAVLLLVPDEDTVLSVPALAYTVTSFAMAMFLLPAAIVAWTEPDRDEDDEDAVVAARGGAR